MEAKSKLLSRRNLLLSGAAIAAGGVALSVSSRAAKAVTLTPGSKVVIVGAGLAGMGAAQKLIDAGMDVEVIEASGRAGGRVYTENVGGNPIDIGAAWLHYGNANALYRQQKDKQQFVETDFSTALIGDLQANPPVIERISSASHIADDIEKELAIPYFKWQVFKHIGLPATKGNLGDLIHNRLGEMMSKMDACGYQNLYRAQYATELKLAGMPNAIGVKGSDPFGADEILDYDGLPEDERLVVGGMKKIFDVEAEGIPITLNEPVDAIDWTDDGVTITTTKRTIEADAVIVTASVGALKSGRIRFGDGLPAKHAKALDQLEMGVLNKVILSFPEGTEWDDKASIYIPCEDPPFDFIVNVKNLMGKPVLVALGGGERAKEIEETEDAVLAQNLREVASKLLGTDLPQPEAVRVTRWSQDEWAQGSYIYYGLDATGHEIEMMRAPIAGRVLFAGEALSITAQGTVNGAFFDGVRAAAEFTK